jgi:hypothetical protein
MAKANEEAKVSVEIEALSHNLTNLEALLSKHKEEAEEVALKHKEEMEMMLDKIHALETVKPTMNFAQVDPDRVFNECLSIGIKLHVANQSAAWLSDPKNLEECCNSATVLAEAMASTIVKRFAT